MFVSPEVSVDRSYGDQTNLISSRLAVHERSERARKTYSFPHSHLSTTSFHIISRMSTSCQLHHSISFPAWVQV